MNKFFIAAASGCMERRLDGQKMYAYLLANDWRPAGKMAEADLVIVSTCAFGEYADRCSVELIRHYADKKKPSAKVIIVGCLPVIDPSKLEGLGEASVVKPTCLEQLDELLMARVRFCDVLEPNKISSLEVSYKAGLKKLLNFRSLWGGRRKRQQPQNLFRVVRNSVRAMAFVRAHINPFLAGIREELFYVRISRGCLGNCTYCAKKFAIGRLQSKSFDQVVGEFKKGLELKEKRFFLVTEDAGCYGMDIGTTIVDLLKAVFAAGEGHDFKLVISNLNAEWFIKYDGGLEELIVREQDKILYVHIPVQSGSDRVLHLMNRPYQIKDLEARLLRLRHKAPAVKFCTDIMVGFPGETEEDVGLTRAFLENVRFDFADIFAYESRPNTPASRMGERPSCDVVERRRLSLLKIQDRYAAPGVVFKKVMEVFRAMIDGKV